MSRILPYPPSAQHLRKEAKSILKAHRGCDPVCLPVLRHLHHLREKPDEVVFSESLNLTGVQFALAMDYGFATWNELMMEVGARLGSDPDSDAVNIKERFQKPSARQSDGNVYLEPIPRYPYTVRRVDENGEAIRHEREPALRCRVVGNLYCMMNMVGPPVEYFEVAAAAGAAFRLSFESRWTQDMEFVTDIDEFTLACDTLGYRGEWLMNNAYAESLAAIDDALQSARPSFVTGWFERFGRVIVGRENATRQYRNIGGLEFEGGIPMPDLGPGEVLHGQIAPEDCPSYPIPESDWYGLILHPDQVARNPVFMIHEGKRLPERERIARTLENALRMNRDYSIDRINIELRKLALENGDSGHDGWKFTFSPWPTRFRMGASALPACAEHIESMQEPTYDFEMIHGIDTAFGGMLNARSRAIVAWLRWAEPKVDSSARKHLEAAREKFTELARVNTSDLGLIRTRPCYVNEPNTENELAELEKLLTTRPALVYMLTWEEKGLVEEHGVEGCPSPWGWRVLPNAEMFEVGKQNAAFNLRRLAATRDDAFAELEAALKTI